MYFFTINGRLINPGIKDTVSCELPVILHGLSFVMLVVMLLSWGISINSNSFNYWYLYVHDIPLLLLSQFWESRNSMVPLEHKMATPDDIADVVVFLASDEAAAMTGVYRPVLCDKGSTLTHSAVDFNQFK